MKIDVDAAECRQGPEANLLVQTEDNSFSKRRGSDKCIRCDFCCPHKQDVIRRGECSDYRWNIQQRRRAVVSCASYDVTMHDGRVQLLYVGINRDET